MNTLAEIRRINFQDLVAKYPNQETIADLIGVTPGYISQLVTGTRDMGEKTARKIEKKANLPTNSLDIDKKLYYIKGLVEMNRQQSGESGAINNLDSAAHVNTVSGPIIAGYVPLISYSQANQLPDNMNYIEPLNLIATTANVSTLAFALRVIGNSMTNPSGMPSIPEGYIVIVDPAIEAKSGSFVVAKLTGNDDVVVKQLVIDGPNRYLKSLNPDYKPITIDDDCKIIGVVKKVEFEP